MLPQESIEETFHIPKKEMIKIMQDYFTKNKGLKFTQLDRNYKDDSLNENTWKARYDIKHRNSFTPEVTIKLKRVDDENTSLQLDYHLFSLTYGFIVFFILIIIIFLFTSEIEKLFSTESLFPIGLIAFTLIIANLGFYSDFEKINKYFKKLIIEIKTTANST